MRSVLLFAFWFSTPGNEDDQKIVLQAFLSLESEKIDK